MYAEGNQRERVRIRSSLKSRKGVWTLEEGIEEARRLGFPVLVRPSYVLGGQGMEITHSDGITLLYVP